MGKINIYETSYEIFLRTRAEDICQLYLSWSNEILSGKVKPNRIIQNIAQRKSMSGEGVKTILKRRGVYLSAKQPVVIPNPDFHRAIIQKQFGENSFQEEVDPVVFSKNLL